MREAGLVRPGVVAIDGTRMAGNASRESTRDFGQIAREILAEAKAIDEAEDELYGDERGDELPEQLRTREGRAEFFRQAREQRAGEASSRSRGQAPDPEPVSDAEQEFEFDAERIVARQPGARGLDAGSAPPARAAPLGEAGSCFSRARGSAGARRASGWRPSATRQVAANRAYEDYRANGRDTQGRRLGRRPKPWVAPECPRGW